MSWINKIPGLSSEVPNIAIETPDNIDVQKQNERDIRVHEFEDEDFNISFTDSTCPFSVVLEQVKVPGMDYHWVRNSAPRINHVMARRWVIVSPDRLANRPTFDLDNKYADMIVVGDTILMERDSRYRPSEDNVLKKKNHDVMLAAVKPLKKNQDLTGQINSLTNPFGN